MRGAFATRRPIGRLPAAALLTVIWLTGVHGAASPDVPPGAIATAHASIGAALVHPGAASPRGTFQVWAGPGVTPAAHRHHKRREDQLASAVARPTNTRWGVARLHRRGFTTSTTNPVNVGGHRTRIAE